jgi:hypothetical protein
MTPQQSMKYIPTIPLAPEKGFPGQLLNRVILSIPVVERKPCRSPQPNL